MVPWILDTATNIHSVAHPTDGFVEKKLNLQGISLTLSCYTNPNNMNIISASLLLKKDIDHIVFNKNKAILYKNKEGKHVPVGLFLYDNESRLFIISKEKIPHTSRYIAINREMEYNMHIMMWRRVINLDEKLLFKMDSGSSFNVTTNLDIVHDFQRQNPVPVRTFWNDMEDIGRGRVVLILYENPEIRRSIPVRVYKSKTDAIVNVISIGWLTTEGKMDIYMNLEGMSVSKNGELLFRATSDMDNKYTLLGRANPPGNK